MFSKIEYLFEKQLKETFIIVFYRNLFIIDENEIHRGEDFEIS